MVIICLNLHEKKLCQVGVSSICIECVTTTLLHTHSWLNWVDEDD